MTTTREQLRLTMTAAIHARFAHRVDGLVHSHPWSIEATVEGPADAAKVMPADDLEALLHELVEPWRGRYLTDDDLGTGRATSRSCGTPSRRSRRSPGGCGTSWPPTCPGWCRSASSSRPSSTAAAPCA